MNVKSGKKKAFYAGIISMILCLIMLVGTTLAWFTDTVVNADNRIVTGSLDVELHMHDGTYNDANEAVYVKVSDSEQGGDIFCLDSDGLGNGNGLSWEPGKTEVVFLKVLNKGSLALDYDFVLDAEIKKDDATGEEAATVGEEFVDIAQALKYAVLSDTDVASYEYNYKEELNNAKNGKEKWKIITAAAAYTGTVSTGDNEVVPNGALEAEMRIILHWQFIWMKKPITYTRDTK